MNKILCFVSCGFCLALFLFGGFGFFVCLFLLFLFLRKVSLCSLGCFGTCHVTQDGLKRTDIHLPLPPKREDLGVIAAATSDLIRHPGSAAALPPCLLKGRHRQETQRDGVFRSPLGSAQSCPELAACTATVCPSHPCLAEGWGTGSNRVPLSLLMWPQRWVFLPSLLYKLAVKASACSVE